MCAFCASWLPALALCTLLLCTLELRIYTCSTLHRTYPHHHHHPHLALCTCVCVLWSCASCSGCDPCACELCIHTDSTLHLTCPHTTPHASGCHTQAYAAEYVERQRRQRALDAHRRHRQQAFILSLALALGGSAVRWLRRAAPRGAEDEDAATARRRTRQRSGGGGGGARGGGDIGISGAAR